MKIKLSDAIPAELLEAYAEGRVDAEVPRGVMHPTMHEREVSERAKEISRRFRSARIVTFANLLDDHHFYGAHLGTELMLIGSQLRTDLMHGVLEFEVKLGKHDAAPKKGIVS